MKAGSCAGPGLWRGAEGPGVSASVSSDDMFELCNCGSGEDVDAEVAEVDVWGGAVFFAALLW